MATAGVVARHTSSCSWRTERRTKGKRVSFTADELDRSSRACVLAAQSIEALVAAPSPTPEKATAAARAIRNALATLETLGAGLPNSVQSGSRLARELADALDRLPARAALDLGIQQRATTVAKALRDRARHLSQRRNAIE